MTVTINGTTGIDKVQDGSIVAADLASGVALSNIGTGGITSDYLASSAQPNSFKNRIINGAMMIDQRNAGASVTYASTSYFSGSAYMLDRWNLVCSQASKFSVQQVASALSGFSASLKATSLSAYSLGTGDYFAIGQRIEGYNVADLNWGTADAAPVTLSFKVYSSLTGTFGGAVTNAGNNRSYPFTYTVSAANTWTTASVTIPGDTSGTWGTVDNVGIQVTFGMGVGTQYSGTAGAWAGTLYMSATGATSVVGTNGATFYITGVQLEKGSTATSFDYRPYGTELALCQRYYWTGVSTNSAYHDGSGSQPSIQFNFPVAQRTTPTLALTVLGSSGNASGANVYSQNATPNGFSFYWGTSGAGMGYMRASINASSEL